MLKIGITGNIGSGKSTVARVFEILGIPVFYADAEAKKVMTYDELLIDGIKKAFGDNAYLPDGTLNRKYIADIVFNSEVELKNLNALVHPAVFRAFNEWSTAFANEPYVIKEAAVLFESGSYKFCDKTVLVAAPIEMRLKRVMDRDHISRAEVEAREARQFTEERKKELADYLLYNDDTQLLIPQILELHRQFLQLV
ncbi:dephospho-CoA kinase [Mucilaginibacter calamicampi]|uniref:Dephospho-CoA kinase n=1 Tax=Mucilaginibacter calamicampi TaxID=1302352 RepID=A0ABW2Z0N0_9SPHI